MNPKEILIRLEKFEKAIESANGNELDYIKTRLNDIENAIPYNSKAFYSDVTSKINLLKNQIMLKEADTKLEEVNEQIAESEDSFYNQVRNKYGNRPDSSETTEIKMEDIDSYINEVKEKMQNAGEDEITKIREELYQKIESYKEQGISDDDLKKLEDFYTNDVMDEIFYYEELGELKLKIKEEENTQGKSTSTEAKEQTNEEQESEEQNVENVEKENTAKDEKLVDLLKQRAELQFQLMVTRGCLLEKNAKKFAKGKVDGLGKYLKDQAEKYGVNKEKYETVLTEYEQALKKAEETYLNNQKTYLTAIGQHEKWENESILALKNAKNAKREYTRSTEYKLAKKKMNKNKEEELNEKTDKELDELFVEKQEKAKEALDKGDNNEATKIIEDLNQIKAIRQLRVFDERVEYQKNQIKDARSGIKGLKRQLRENEKQYEKALDNAEDNYEKSLAKIDKQSIIGKAIGRISSLFKKINGNEKFQKEIVTPVKETTKHIFTEVLPSFGKGIKTGIESIPGGIKSVAENLKQKKNNAIDRFKASIKDKNTEDKTKLDKMNNEISKDDNDEHEEI